MAYFSFNASLDSFEIMTGMSISQYVKNRRLYLAAVEILKGAKVIDTAVKYCYTTPESFSKSASNCSEYSVILKNH